MSQTDRMWWYIAMDCDESNKECFSHWQTIHIAALIPTVLSIIACLFMIITGIKYHKILSNLSLAAQLPIYISISDLTFEIFHGGDHLHSLIHSFIFKDPWCVLFGSMKAFGVNIQTAWALGVSTYLIRTIFNASGEEIMFGKHNVYLHAFCWGAPLIIFFFGFIFDAYGKSLGPWCDVADPATHFLMVDVWMVIVILALIVNYGLIIYKLGSVINLSSSKKCKANERNYGTLHCRMKKVMRTVGLYPIAFIAQWFAYMIYLTNVVPQTYAISLWVVITGNCGGIFNLFLYGPLLLNQIKNEKRRRETTKRATAIGVIKMTERPKSDHNRTETKDNRADECVAIEMTQIVQQTEE